VRYELVPGLVVSMAISQKEMADTMVSSRCNAASVSLVARVPS
jgi:hypothetical protein